MRITETGKLIAGTGKLNCDGYGLDYNNHCLNCKEACSTAITFSQLQHNYFILRKEDGNRNDSHCNASYLPCN
jgi:hypothetical protein